MNMYFMMLKESVTDMINEAMKGLVDGEKQRRVDAFALVSQGQRFATSIRRHMSGEQRQPHKCGLVKKGRDGPKIIVPLMTPPRITREG